MISFSTVANGRDIKVYEILQKMFQNFGKVSKNFYFAKISLNFRPFQPSFALKTS